MVHPDHGLFLAIMTTLARTATVGEGTTIGHYCVIEDHVQIGKGCQIGHHAVIRSGTVLGDGVKVGDHTCLGKEPMRASNSALKKETPTGILHVGDHCLIGTAVILYAGCTLDSHVMVADLATVREDVTVGTCSIIGRGVCVENSCVIGSYCKLETNSYITAYSQLGDRVFIAPGVLTGNDNYVGRTRDRHKHFRGATIHRGGRIGLGAIVLPGREVEHDALVAAGSVLTRTAPSGQIWAGVPARFLRKVPKDQRLEKQGWSDVKPRDDA